MSSKLIGKIIILSTLMSLAGCTMPNGLTTQTSPPSSSPIVDYDTLRSALLGDNGTLSARWGLVNCRLWGEICPRIDCPECKHTGVDYGTDGVFVDVYSATDGVVTGLNDEYGKICIYHESTDVTFCYFHLSSFEVSRGSSVRQGDPIGQTGKAGDVSIIHLHFEAKLGMHEKGACCYCDTIDPVEAARSARTMTSPPSLPETCQAAETPTELPPTPTAVTETPGWLPDGTIALYTAGSRIYSLAADGSTTDLGWEAGGLMSRTGRWIAYVSGPASARIVTVENLGTGATFVSPLNPHSYVSGWAFDYNETRLAFLDHIGLTIGVVSLADGSTARFAWTFPPDYGLNTGMWPGYPIGWSTTTDELLLNTFMPDTEGWNLGVWGVIIPTGTASTALESLNRREILPSGSYVWDPQLSPDASQLLYMGRDYSYTPDDYELGWGYLLDGAVNELWVVNLADAKQRRLVNVIDGGALVSYATWSHDSSQILFAQGRYAGGTTLTSLTLKIHNIDSDTVSDVGPVPMPAGGRLSEINWCTPESSLISVQGPSWSDPYELHMVDMTTGTSSLVVSDLGGVSCVP